MIKFSSPPTPPRGNTLFSEASRLCRSASHSVIIAILMIGLIGGNVVAGEPYMLPYKETMMLFVHGVNSDRYTWFEPTEKGLIKEDGDTNKWIHYINRELGVHEDLLKRYSFSRHSGYHEVNMLEFGNGGYENEASDPDAENNKGEMSLPDGGKVKKKTGIEANRSWLEQARAEYKQALFGDSKINTIDPITKLPLWQKESEVPDALLPSKLVMLGHSQANYAIRGYIQSGALARERGFFQDGESVPDYLLSETGKRKIKENPLGFYEWPVEKVVFINPPLKGSDAAWVLVCVGVPLS